MLMRSTALITGASGGIGAEIAREIAADKHNLILVARNRASMQALADELSAKHGISVTVFDCDLTQPNASADLHRRVTEAGLRVDVLINNAGVGFHDFLHEQDSKRIYDTNALSITALTELTRLFLPDMVAHKCGGVINVASIAAFVPEPTMAVYAASKAYVLSLTLALSEEFKGTGVVATVLCPGPTKSNFFKTAEMEDNPLVSSSAMMDADVVAKAAWSGFKKGKRLVMPGIKNKLTTILGAILPYDILLPGIMRTLMAKA